MKLEYYNKEYWNKKAKSSDAVGKDRYGSELLKLIFSLLPTDGLYLEVGCGEGELLRAIANKHTNVLGIEPSEYAFAKLSDLKAIKASAENLPVENNSVSLIFAHHVIEHLDKPTLFFDEVYRVLKPSGYFIFITGPVLPFGTISFWKKIGFVREPSHTAVTTKRNWRRLLSNSGLLVQKDLWRLVSIDPPNMRIIRSLPRIMQVLATIFLRYGAIVTKNS